LSGPQLQNEIVKKYAQKIALWTQIPEENGEPFYVIRYQKGEQYRPHHDYFSEDEHGRPFIGDRGNRIATVLMYLEPAEIGGETIFPRKELEIKAKQGDAILFFSANPHLTEDNQLSYNADTLHGGNPVVAGVKWVCTRWIREKGSFVEDSLETVLIVLLILIILLSLLLISVVSCDKRGRCQFTKESFE